MVVVLSELKSTPCMYKTKDWMSVFAASALVVFGSLFTGCASIVKGTTQAIPVSSSPSGADISLDGNRVGQTPGSIEVKRKSDHLMTIEKAGYHPESVAITRNIGGAVFGNILAGGLIGWGVDAISGAQYNLTPATINLTLKPLAEGESRRSVTESSAVVFIRELKILDERHESGKIKDEDYAKQRIALVEKYSPTALPGASPETSQLGTNKGEGDTYRNLTPGVKASEPTDRDKMEDLKKMRDSGLITEEEYQAKRKVILDRM